MVELDNCFYDKATHSYRVRIKPEELLRISVPHQVLILPLDELRPGMFTRSEADVAEDTEFIQTDTDSEGRGIFTLRFNKMLIIDNYQTIEAQLYVVDLILHDPYERERKINSFFRCAC